MFKKWFGRETPEEKAAREAAEAEARAAEAEAERIKKQAKLDAESQKRREKEAADYLKKHGRPMPEPTPSPSPSPNAATAAGFAPAPAGVMGMVGAPLASPGSFGVPYGAPPPPAAAASSTELSHEQQMKQAAIAAQQAALAQQIELARAQQLQQQQQQQAQSAYPVLPPGSATVSPVAGPPCDDCENKPAVCKCDECDAGTAGSTSLFCAECDEAYHRGKRVTHTRKPLAPPPAAPVQAQFPAPVGSASVAPSAPVPAVGDALAAAPVVGTFVPLGADPNNPAHVSVLRDPAASPHVINAPAMAPQGQPMTGAPGLPLAPLAPIAAAVAAPAPTVAAFPSVGASNNDALPPSQQPLALDRGLSQAKPFSSSFALSSPSSNASSPANAAPATTSVAADASLQPQQQSQQQLSQPQDASVAVQQLEQAQSFEPGLQQPVSGHQQLEPIQSRMSLQPGQSLPLSPQQQQQPEQSGQFQQSLVADVTAPQWPQQQQPRSDQQQPQLSLEPPQPQQQPPEIPQRPIIPSMQLGAAQDLQQQQLQEQQPQPSQHEQQSQQMQQPEQQQQTQDGSMMLTPRTAAARGLGQQHTPRNPDGSVNFDARHRTMHTPRTQAEIASRHAAGGGVPTQEQMAHQQQQPYQPPPPQASASLVGAEHNSDVAQLHDDEVSELREMFSKYDVNGDHHLALDEVSRFLHELEFTYAEPFVRFLIDHVFGMHIHERVGMRPAAAAGPVGSPTAASGAARRIKGMLTFPEFLEFMRVFYWLHDHVVAEIERQFEHAFGKQVDDEIVAVLCRFVRFNEHAELDFNEMNLRLVEAVNAEAERAREEAAEEEARRCGEDPYQRRLDESLQSPLVAQHAAQLRREDEQKALEARQADETWRAEQQAAAAAREREEQEKQYLAQQREHYRAEAIRLQQQQQQPQYHGQQQALSPVNEYQDSQHDEDPFAEMNRAAEATTAQPAPPHPEYSQPQQQQQQPQPLQEQQQQPLRQSPQQSQQPQQHYQYPAEESIQLRAGPASLLAHSLDASDEEYLRRSWSLLLKHFDRSNSGSLSALDIGQAFRAMGLDPSGAQLAEFFQRSDLDGSGAIDYREFAAYYSALFNSYLRRGLELGQLKRIFKKFDEDGDGRTTVAEFRHVVKLICPSDMELSAEDVERLVRLADRNGDGVVDFNEFLELIRLSTAEQPPPLPAILQAGETGAPASELAAAERARHESLMSYHAARALTRKIIRAHMPSPMEHLLAFAHMPSSFRASMLARYTTRAEFFPSSILNPVLHSSGLHYEQFQMDPRTHTLRSQPLNPSTGASNPAHHGYVIELEHASGIPLPLEQAHRADIVARRVRVCLLQGSTATAGDGATQRPLSNLYMCKAEWDPSEEDRWNFQLRFKEQDANTFLFKTEAVECTLLLEFTCLVRKQGSAGPNAAEKKGQHPSDSHFIEMSCGFATLELNLATPLLKETRVVAAVLGGNIAQAVAIKDSEVVARRTGFKAFTQLFAGPVRSQVSLKLAPLYLRTDGALGGGDYSRVVIASSRLLPCNLLLSWSSVEVVKLFLELLAGFVLPAALQPLTVGKSSQLAIQTFLRGVVDTPDMLQVLAELWADTRRGIKKQALREHDAGPIVHVASAAATGMSGIPQYGSAALELASDTTSAHLLRQFRRCILRLLPALSLAPGVLPPYILGVTDLKRLSLLRALVHVADPLSVLTADGMLRSMPGTVATAAAGAGPIGGTTGVTRAPMSLARAASVQNARSDVAAAAAAAAAAREQHSSFGGSNRVGGGGLSSSAGVVANPLSGLRADGSVDPYVGSVELRHVYAPFHTNEVAFDPNGHSEEHHLERRAAIELQLASSPTENYA